MTAFGTVPKAVEAMQAGAVDYLIKPFAAKALVSKVAAYVTAGTVDSKHSIQQRVVQDEVMATLYELVARVAKTEVTVLLQGESGTGKGSYGRYIHQNSSYHDGPFIAVNVPPFRKTCWKRCCSVMKKGAFTGAVQAMPGKFEQAQEGTLIAG